MINKIILGSLILFISGCATIAGKSDYPVTINSSPSEAKFILTNKSGQQVHSGQTPATVNLKSGAGYFSGETYSVKYSKDGYADNNSLIDSNLSGWYAGNLLFGGAIGLLIVDPLTGAMWKLPDNTSASLIKKP